MRILVLKEKMRELKALDTDFEIFEAEQYSNLFNSVLTFEDIKAFERRYKIQLPEDYREFLMKIGNGGVGPYFGIFKLEDDSEENITNYQTLHKPYL